MDIILARTNHHQNSNYKTFKAKQWESVNAAKSKDVFVVLPTGYGKSLIIQALPFVTLKPSCIVVVNPLNAIILEQAQRFVGNIVVDLPLLSEIRERLNGKKIIPSNSKTQNDVTNLLDGKVTFIIGHPEYLLTDTIKSVFKRKAICNQITHIAIDEAHCVLSWDKSEFRQAFMKLGSLRSILPEAKIVALTDTVTAADQREIEKVILMENPVTVKASPDRPNLFLEVRRRQPSTGARNSVEESVNEVLDPLLAELQTKGTSFPKTIVYMPLKWCGYAHHRAVTKYLADHPDENTLQDEETPAMTCLVSQFHAPQSRGMKERISKDIQDPNGHLRLLFCTEAYSMGADPANVTNVIHLGPPNSIETYIQEIGRSGRDGYHAKASLVFNNNDMGDNRKNLQPAMKQYMTISSCRRQYLLEYFGFEIDCNRTIEKCCDNCLTNTSSIVDLPLLDQNQQLQQRCYTSLNFYFKQENSLKSLGPLAETMTGLSKWLAQKLSLEPTKYNEETELHKSFPHLKPLYQESIALILNAEIVKLNTQ